MRHEEIVALVVVGLALLAAALYLIVVVGRKRQLLGKAGGLPMALRVEREAWSLGVGRYVGAELWWYAAFRLGRRPTRTLVRGTLEVTGQRGRRPDEPMLAPGSVVVECTANGEHVSLSFAGSAVTGFLSWLESAAPRG